MVVIKIDLDKGVFFSSCLILSQVYDETFRDLLSDVFRPERLSDISRSKFFFKFYQNLLVYGKH